MKKILVLEDDAILRLLYEKLLSKHGYSVSVAETYNEAVEFLDNEKFDLYIVDLMLSDGENDGLKFISLGIGPVFIITAVEINQSNLEHFKHYIRKPFRNNELISKIEEILHENN